MKKLWIWLGLLMMFSIVHSQELLKITNNGKTLAILEGDRYGKTTIFAVGPSNSMQEEAIAVTLWNDAYGKLGELIIFLGLNGQKKTSWSFKQGDVTMKLTFRKANIVWKMSDPLGSESISLGKIDVEKIKLLLTSRAKL